MDTKPFALFNPASPLNRLRASTRSEDKLRGYFHWLGQRKQQAGAPKATTPLAPGKRLAYRALRAGAPTQPLPCELDLSFVPAEREGERRLVVRLKLRDAADFPRTVTGCRLYFLEPSVVERLARRSLPQNKDRAPSSPGTLVPQAALAAHPEGLTALAFLPKGRVATGGADGQVRLWADDTTSVTLACHSGGVRALVVAANGGLASSGQDGVVCWCPPSGTTAHCIATRPGPVTALAVLADGRVASAGADGRVLLTGPVTGTAQALDLRRPVVLLAAQPDGRLAIVDAAGAVLVWDTVSGAIETAAWEGRGQPLAALGDGRMAFFDGRSSQVRIWGPGSAEQAFPSSGPMPVVAAALPDGRLALVSKDNVVSVLSPSATAELQGAGDLMPLIFRDDFLGRDLDAARVLSAVPEVEGTIDAQGVGRLARPCVPGGPGAISLDDLCGRVFFAVVIDQ